MVNSLLSFLSFKPFNSNNKLVKRAIILWPYAVLALVSVIVYLPTFSGEFILDDNILIKNNPYVNELHSLASYLSQEDGIVDQRDLGVYHTGYYRPLINFTYWIDYKIWGMKPYGFRTTNLVLHIITIFIIFRLIKHLLKNQAAALTSCILFAIHPVNTETVCIVVSRNNILAALFGILSFYFYIIRWEKKKYSAFFISILTYSLAIFSKEFGLMTMALFFFYHRFMSEEKNKILPEIASYLPYILMTMIYFFLRQNVIGSVLTPFDMGQFWKKIYFVPYLIIFNLKLVLFPLSLHQFNVSYPNSLFNFQVLFSIILFFILFYLFWKYIKNRIIRFSGLSFLVLLFPVLGIIPTASGPHGLIALRWLYFPLAMLLLGIAWLIHKSFNSRRFVYHILISVLIVYLGIYSYVLNNFHWHEENRFCKQEVLAFNNLLYAGGVAEIFHTEKEYVLSEKYFDIALRKYPYQVHNYINYSALLIDIGKYESALSLLQKPTSLTMSNQEKGQWYNNWGTALSYLGRNAEALTAFRIAVLYSPDKSLFWSNLGSAYGINGNYESSIKAFKNAIVINPNNKLQKKNLEKAYIKLKGSQKKIKEIE